MYGLHLAQDLHGKTRVSGELARLYLHRWLDVMIIGHCCCI